MRIARLLVIVVLAGGAWYYSDRELKKMDAEEAVSTQGFAAMTMPDGMSARGVIIFSPKDCPSDAAQRAEALAQSLRSAGIEFSRSDEANFGDLPDADTAARIEAVMNGPVPVVFVNGKAKANPSAAEVIAELHSGQKG
ncbi:MAG TPA: hypothetical protein VKM35_06155 [Arenimonas sp.]|uniref:hypothetical protein n=1 Tax=Arenimonas sp. TaxID=1872635 RepID=UPI002CD0279F|nr:hypothetical protein [Arenimonas sp.]HMB56774.1 hypothetical protein [Arenimonas sp.]